MNRFVHFIKTYFLTFKGQKNRFVYLLLIFFSSCSTDEPVCTIDTSSSGQIFSVVRSWDNRDTGATEFFLGDEIAPGLCDSLVFSSIRFPSFEVTLDSAYIDLCNECLEVFHWSGPGCAIEPVPSTESVSFHDQEWRIAEVAVGDTLIYPPCSNSMIGRFNADGTADFLMGNGYRMNYILDGQRLNFMLPFESTLAFFGGYTGVVEGFLGRHLLTLESWQVELHQDSRQLVLSRHDPPIRILMIQ